MKSTATFSSILGALVIGIGFAIGATGPAAGTSIKAVVNDEPITSYDVAQRRSLMRLGNRGRAVSQKAALDELIEERLKIQEARRRGMTVSTEEVEQVFAGIARRTKLSPARLTRELGRIGIKASSLKGRLRADMMWSKVVRARFRHSVNVTEQDVIAALAKEGGAEARTSNEYRLEQVIVVVPKKASRATRTRKRRDADNLRKRFTSCEDGLAMARKLPEVVVKPVGFRTEADMPDQTLKLVKDTAVGRLTKAVDIDNGLQMLAVCDKREIRSDAAARREIEDKMLDEEGQLLSRRYLRDLRRDAIIEYK